MTVIGLLLCDGTYPEIRNKWGNYENCFADLLTHMGYEFSEYKVWHCIIGELPQNVDEADIYIVSGSKYSSYEPFDWMKNLKEFIIQLDNHQKKLLGFCFGHQIIHEALGGKVALAPKGWGLGAYPIYAQNNFSPLQKGEEIRVLSMHQDQVVQMAQGFETLGSSSFCPHGITQKGDKILTFQSHAEFHDEWFYMLCKRIKPRVKYEVIEKALLTIKKQKNKQKILLAIDGFLRK